MAQQLLNLGTVANDKTGTKGRAGGEIINDNFTELYSVTTTNTADIASNTSGTATNAGDITTLNGYVPSAALLVDGSVDGTNQKFSNHLSIGGEASINSNIIVNASESFVSPTTTTNAGKFKLAVSGTTAHTMYALEFAVESSGAGNFGELTGGYYAPVHSGSGQATKTRGAASYLINSGGGSIVTARMFETTTINFNASTITDYIAYYASDVLNIVGSTITNQSAFWAEKSTAGTNNYGLVLDGDDLGADIAFGASQQLRMHHDGTNLTLEGAGIAAVASTATINASVPIDINGTVYHIMLSTTA